jgi:hypothetical protein
MSGKGFSDVSRRRMAGGLSADDDPATSRLPVRAPVGGVGLGDAGGEQAEVVGEGAVGEVGDA